MLGHDKQTGVPLSTLHKHDVPDYASGPEGKVTALDSHIRPTNLRTAESESSLMLRRGCIYSSDAANSEQLDTRLLLVCYQYDLEKGFLTIQKRLNGEALEEYVKPIGGSYFFALPGIKDANGYPGSVLLRVQCFQMGKAFTPHQAFAHRCDAHASYHAHNRRGSVGRVRRSCHIQQTFTSTANLTESTQLFSSLSSLHYLSSRD